jgi:hypothetical protein
VEVVEGDVVVDVVALAVAKATNLVAPATTRRPSPTPGVGKWFAGTPTEAS